MWWLNVSRTQAAIPITLIRANPKHPAPEYLWWANRIMAFMLLQATAKIKSGQPAEQNHWPAQAVEHCPWIDTRAGHFLFYYRTNFRPLIKRFGNVIDLLKELSLRQTYFCGYPPTTRFFFSVKNLAGITITTFAFDIVVIWIMSLLLYFIYWTL